MLTIQDLKKLLVNLLVFRNLINCLLYAIIPSLIFYSLSLFSLTSSGFEIMEVLRDPAQQHGSSSFLGFLSNIGIWLWISSVAICFFFVFSKKMSNHANVKGLLFLAGLLSLLLAVDDFFMIHDRYVDQKICYLVYAICLGLLFIRHFEMISQIQGLAFLIAGLLLGASIGTDLIQFKIPFDYVYIQVCEEGFKFLGASTWLYFNCSVASFLIKITLEQDGS